jgi:predicted nucleotidyltransferase
MSATQKKTKSSNDGNYHLVNFLRNWLHQAITYMDTGERTVRLAMESAEIVILWVLLETFVMPAGLHAALPLTVSTVLVHTLNWIFNGNFWALYLFAVPNAENRGEAETVRYLNAMARRLERSASVSGLALFGSVARGKWHKCSDIDIRIIRNPGIANLIAASIVAMRERLYALLNRQPLDLFLADDVKFLRKMRSDETPIFLLKRDTRLDNEYPGNPAVNLAGLRFNQT